jgi:hypothetical protein
MRSYTTALDVITEPDTFRGVYELAQTIKPDNEYFHNIRSYGAKFDPDDMRRFYHGQNHQGAAFKLFEDNEFRMEISHNMGEVMHLDSLGVLLSPVKRIINYCEEITAHIEGNSVPIKVPMNNIDKNQFIIINLANQEDGRIRFDLSEKQRQVFRQDPLGKYVHQPESIRNFYMPPSREVRKEYRDKIDALIKKVTLMSFIKDDTSIAEAPKELHNIYLSEWRRYSNDSSLVYEKVFDYISNNYDGQRILKQTIDTNINQYVGTVDLIRAMLKHYLEYRMDVPVDYFTCKTHRSWRQDT